MEKLVHNQQERDAHNEVINADLTTCRFNSRHTYNPKLVAEISQVMDIIEERRQVYRGREQEPWTARAAFMTRALELCGDGTNPLLFAFPGFPCKSPNTETKVLGQHPDMAERMSIGNLREMLDEISRVYRGGAALMIISDGLPFSNIFHIKDQIVHEYVNELRELAHGHSIEFLSMLEIIKDGATIEEKRQILVQRYGPDMNLLVERIKNDPETNSYYTGLKLFLEGDMAPYWAETHGGGKEIGRTLRNKLSGELAKEFMLLNEAFNRAVEAVVPQCLRLSCHPQFGDNPHKVGIELIFGRQRQAWATPWHNAMVRHEDGRWDITRKKAALEHGCQIEEDARGRPSHFVAPGISA